MSNKNHEAERRDDLARRKAQKAEKMKHPSGKSGYANKVKGRNSPFAQRFGGQSEYVPAPEPRPASWDIRSVLNGRRKSGN